MTATSSPSPARERLLEVISRHWGYSSFRPMQEEAMTAALSRRDSLVVLPTGGGKSLCYQAPAMLEEKITVVVSPLISLMKDQVDGLIECGVPAVQMNSSQDGLEHRAIEHDIRSGRVKLLFVSPERLAMASFREVLRRAGVGAFAIDEAHCISHWGHDFRPEYRQLRAIKQIFPEARVHAYTATAAEAVRRDIVQQLALADPLVLVGSFDRPNLTYRVLPRRDELRQTIEVIERHKGEAGIIYCLRRRDVDDLTAGLRRAGYNAVAYHAGLPQQERREAQDAFSSERCDLVVATVAFGMGIDRSNVRFVLHAAMPKSVEHYQQETGRAGRDGLEAECVLLYSGGDAVVWRTMLSGSEVEVSAEYLAASMRHVGDIDRYCSGSVCRHRALSEYFGQQLEAEHCGACDLCLGDTEEVKDALVVAQKILSCVYRVGQSFGVAHVVSVLRGEDTERIRERNHNQLSTYGILKGHAKNDLRDWIYQLVSQGFLAQSGDQYPVLRLTETSRTLMRGEAVVRLRQPVAAPADAAGKMPAAESWEGVDRDLFEELRQWRRRQAEGRGVPPYVIFGDRALREMARLRPTNLTTLRGVYGVGDSKLSEHGQKLIEVISAFCKLHGLTTDLAGGQQASVAPAGSGGLRLRASIASASALFKRGASIDEAMRETGRSRGTVVGYLCAFIDETLPASVAPWVADSVYERVAIAADELGPSLLRPLRERLGEDVSYDEIRIVLAHLKTR